MRSPVFCLCPGSSLPFAPRSRANAPVFLWILIPTTTGPALGVAQEPAEAGLSPRMTFTAEPFSRVRGVYELPDGRLLVADQREEALYRIDVTTGEREMLGRRGGGPEEYRSPTGLHPFRGDSVVLVDIQNGRLAILDADGVIGRTTPLFGPGITIPSWIDEAGNRYWDRISSVRLAKREDPRVDRAPVVRYRVGTGELDTLAFLTVPGPPNPSAFPPWDEWSVGPDGWIAVVRNQDEYRLDWIEPDGSVRRGDPVEGFEPLRVSADDEEAVAEGRGGGVGGAVIGGEGPRRRPRIEVPDRFPPAKLGGVWVGYDGRAYVERHQHLDEERPLLDVFDRSGRRVQRYRLPPGREVVGVGPSGLYVVREDELGLQWLERYDPQPPGR